MQNNQITAGENIDANIDLKQRCTQQNMGSNSLNMSSEDEPTDENSVRVVSWVGYIKSMDPTTRAFAGAIFLLLVIAIGYAVFKKKEVHVVRPVLVMNPMLTTHV